MPRHSASTLREGKKQVCEEIGLSACRGEYQLNAGQHLDNAGDNLQAENRADFLTRATATGPTCDPKLILDRAERKNGWRRLNQILEETAHGRVFSTRITYTGRIHRSWH